MSKTVTLHTIRFNGVQKAETKAITLTKGDNFVLTKNDADPTKAAIFLQQDDGGIDFLELSEPFEVVYRMLATLLPHKSTGL